MQMITSTNHFHDKLIELKSELLTQSNVFRNEGQLGDNESRTSKGDEADQAASEINLNLSLSLRERDRLLLQKIDYALSKLQSGSFGECEACEADIEPRRLIARPYTTLCIACKEEQEHQRRFFA